MKNQIIELIKSNPEIGVTELAKILKVARSTIYKNLRELNLKARTKKFTPFKSRDKIIISDKLDSFIIGSLLGDGHCTKTKRSEDSRKNCNSKISMKHCLKQKEYVLYKKSLIDDDIKTTFVEYKKREDKRNWNIQPTICLDLQQNLSFNQYRKNWYPEGIKIIPFDNLSNFNELSLAIWFQDDGTKNKTGGYTFCTNSFSVEDNQKMCDFLMKKYNLICTVQNPKKPCIYVSKKSIDTFNNLVLPYIHHSMKYKLHLSE